MGSPKAGHGHAHRMNAPSCRKLFSVATAAYGVSSAAVIAVVALPGRQWSKPAGIGTHASPRVLMEARLQSKTSQTNGHDFSAETAGERPGSTPPPALARFRAFSPQ